MKLKTDPVKGVRDVLPPESEIMRILIDKFVGVVKSYGYVEVVPPTIEHLELFTIKSGPEIVKSMYVFKDKAGREVCLRPEFTASIARIYLRSMLSEPKPIKVFYVGNAFRYEEPQLGRYREFTQMGVEYIGDNSVYADLELLLILRDYYKTIGLNDYSIKVNNVGILRSLFTSWGINEDVQDLILHYMDKKLIDEAVALLSQYPKADLELFNYLISIKTENVDDLNEVLNKLSVSETTSLKLERLIKFARAAKNLNVGKLVLDLSFARGLAYYTDIIFEVTAPALNVSIGGGGRYDTLIGLYGGPNTPATGFALGGERTYLALKSLGAFERLPLGIKVMLISLIEDYLLIDRVAMKLRDNGYLVDVRFTGKSRLGDIIGLASRKEYDYIVVYGEKEAKLGRITVKNLVNRTQRECDIDDVVRCLE